MRACLMLLAILVPSLPTEPGYYRLPYWNALGYLEAVAKSAGENDDVALAGKVMDVVRQCEPLARQRRQHS